MAALREVFAEFGIDFDRRRALARGNRRVNRMRDGLRRLGSVVSGVRAQLLLFSGAIGGALAVRGISRFIGNVVELGDDLDKVSQQVGMSTRDLQAWRHTAELSGVDAAAFGNALGQLQRNAYEANRGTATMVEAFDRLGISVNDAAGNLKDPNTLLLEMADGLQGIDNASERTALAMTILGRSGRRMLPLFAQGSDGAQAMLAELEELGGGMSELSIQQSVRLTDDITRLKLAFRSFASQIGTTVIPAINRMVIALTGVRAGMQDIIDNTSTVRAVLISAILAVAAVLLATLPLWGPWAAAIGGVVIIAAALGFLIDDIWKAMEGGDAVVVRIGNAMADWLRTAIQGTGILATQLQSLLRTYNLLAGVLNLPPIALEGITGEAGAAQQTGAGLRQSISTVAGSTTGQIFGGAGARRGVDLPIIGERTSRGRRGVQAPLFDPLDDPRFAGRRPARPRMQGRQQQVVNQRITAPATTNVTINEATDAQENARIVGQRIRDENQRQLRQIRAATVPAIGTGASG